MACPETPADRIRELEALVHVPGMRRCQKCGFEKTFLAAGPDGPVAVEPERADCPTCLRPMWRVTERVRREEVEDQMAAAFAELVGRPDEKRMRSLLNQAFQVGLYSRAMPRDEVENRRRFVLAWADGRAAAEGGVA